MDDYFLNQIIWLASYPKSGNTWVRFLLTNLLQGKPDTAADVEDRIPDIHVCLADSNSPNLEAIYKWDPSLLKSHLAFSPKMPLFENTIGFIYIVRNPLDVIISNLNYVFLLAYGQLKTQLQQEQIQQFSSEYINRFIHLKGDERWVKLGMGTWESHVESWLDNDYGFPHLIVKYEDLLAEPMQEVRRISTFLQLDVSDEKLQETIANSSFSAVKKVEDRTIERKELGMFYQPTYEAAHNSGIRFMSKGKRGEGKRQLSAEQVERAKAAFFPLLKRFNYL